MDDRQKTIDQIREFNRFYTVLLGFLNRNYLDSGYSVTEIRILFELKQNKQMSANRLIDMLHLDKSYISRLIRSFEQKGLVTRTASPDDKRFLIIRLTPMGLAETEKLVAITNREINELIRQFDHKTCDGLCKSMKKIIDIFSDNNHNHEEERYENGQ